jgi:cell wall assembly regulator SMI1
VAATGPAGWVTVAAAIAAAGGDRVAAVVIGDDPADLVRACSTTFVAVPLAARADTVVRIAEALVPAHDRVVVTAPGGLLAPLGGFTLADVAWALRAPVVVAADEGTVNDVLLTLEVLERRHVAAAVVAVGPTDRLADDLPVALGGEIPDGAADLPDFAERAPGWLDPVLRAPAEDDDPVDPAAEGVDAAAPARSGRAVTGKRVAIAALILAVAALQALYMITLFTDEPATLEVEARVAGVEVAQRTPRPLPPTPVAAARCTPARSNAVQQPMPDAATTARVDAAWARIEAALAARAPMVAASLRPGTTTDRVLAVQARMGVPLPVDLVASLLRHDGAVARSGFEFPPFHRYIGVEEIYTEWLSTCRALGAARDDATWWHHWFIPFAEAGDGGSLLVDQRPGMGGRVGDFFPDDGTRFDNQPPSFTALLEAVATSLETGRPYRPVPLPDGTLDWQ